MPKLKITLLTLLGGAFVSACSTADIQARDRLNYKSAQQANALELPPDLSGQQPRTNYAANVLSEYRKTQGRAQSGVEVLPQSAQVRLVRSGENRWISAQLPAEYVWNQSVQFFNEIGLDIEKSDPQAGILESRWMENRPEVKETFIRRFLQVAADQLFSSPIRDKFKLRLEREDSNTVLVYVTHYGLRDQASGHDDQYHTWVERPRDPELEAEFLSRLVTKLGGPTGEVVDNADLATVEMVTDNQLIVNRPFQSVWIQVGNIFDDGQSFRIDELNRESSSYRVLRAAGKKGIFKKRTLYDAYRVQVSENSQGSTLIEITPEVLGKPLTPLMDKIKTNLY